MRPRTDQFVRVVALATMSIFFWSALAGAAPPTSCVNPGGPGGCFASVQAAVDAATCGTTIDVAAGTHVAEVVIKNHVDTISYVVRAEFSNRVEVESSEIFDDATGALVGAAMTIRDSTMRDNGNVGQPVGGVNALPGSRRSAWRPGAGARGPTSAACRAVRRATSERSSCPEVVRRAASVASLRREPSAQLLGLSGVELLVNERRGRPRRGRRLARASPHGPPGRSTSWRGTSYAYPQRGTGRAARGHGRRAKTGRTPARQARSFVSR